MSSRRRACEVSLQFLKFLGLLSEISSLEGLGSQVTPSLSYRNKGAAVSTGFVRPGIGCSPGRPESLLGPAATSLDTLRTARTAQHHVWMPLTMIGRAVQSPGAPN